MDVVEKVARAICRAGICGPRAHLDEQETANWRKFEIESRAAIEALRVPTQAMLDAGPGEPYMDNYVWEKMIDAALNGQERKKE